MPALAKSSDSQFPFAPLNSALRDLHRSDHRTTTLAFAFGGLSIVLVLVLPRGGILIIAPLVECHLQPACSLVLMGRDAPPVCCGDGGPG